MAENLYFVEEPRIETQGIMATHVTVKSETAEYTASLANIPDENKIEQLVPIEEGSQAICQAVAEELLARWGREQLSINGPIDLTVKLRFKEKVRVVIPAAGIDGLFIVQKKVHNLANFTTEVTCGDIILSNNELLARIMEKLE